MDANLMLHQSVKKTLVSIHAPVMDANHRFKRGHLLVGVSIHAPVMDAKILRLIYYLILLFQSTRP